MNRLKKWGLALCAAAVLLSPASASGPASEDGGVRLPVVMYHHISPEKRLWGDYVISVEQFERDLRYLRDAGYESVGVRELLAWADGIGALPEKPVVITLDDGYETTGAYAAPLLEQYGFTGVVAVIGSVARQYSELPDHNKVYSHLSWEAVAELARSGVLEVQYHSWNMHRLSPRKGCNRMRGEDAALYARRLTEDVARFRADCEEYGVEPVPSAAFPFGSYCSDTIETLRALGFRAAFTCTERVNLLTGDAAELLELGRFNRPHGKSSEAFFGKWDT